MKKILVMGASGLNIEFVKAAKKRGIYTIVTDYFAPEISVAKLEADEHWMISTADLDTLERKCKEERIDGIVCGPSDFNVEMTMQLCERLGLSCYCTKEAWHYSRDKADFKKICKEIGAPVPEDYEITNALSDEELEQVKFPVMVKPVDMWGNRGVSYCYNKEDLIQAYHYAHEVSSNPKTIVERMLHGEEWYAFYAMADGEVSLLALNAMYSQEGEPKNCYSITTTASAHVERFIQEINPKLVQVLKKCGCREGMAWIQVMLDEDNQFYVIEMGYRLDGDMMFFLYKDLMGFDSVNWMIDCALGIKHKTSELPIAPENAFTKCACAYMLWTNGEGEIALIQGLEEVKKIPGVTVEMSVRVGDSVSKYQSIGNILYCSENCDEMCEVIEKINKLVQVKNTDEEDVIIYYTAFDYLKGEYKKGLAGGLRNED